MKRQRKTKIIGTIGPASDSVEILTKLVKAGMNVARLNCSHGDIAQREKYVKLLHSVRDKLKKPLAIMLDTKGPEFRIKTFKHGQVDLKNGQSFVLTNKDIEGDETNVSVTYKELYKDLKKGDIILANDGLIKLKVQSIKDKDIFCKVIIGGPLSNNKSLNFPGKDLHLEYLSDNDKKDLKFCADHNIEYVACSFVSCYEDVKAVRDYLDSVGGQNVDILAKIENQSGVNNLKEISKCCCGFMVARGDLGVEIDYDMLPVIQKRIIKKCRKWGKVAITCTEMLESMIYEPRPTRAEISDVANAVYDTSSALMLSGETAAGKYPVEAIKVMSGIIKTTEKFVYKHSDLSRNNVASTQTADAAAHAACIMAQDVEAKAIMECSEDGETPKYISNFRPSIDVYVIVGDSLLYHKLALYFGLNAIATDPDTDFDGLMNLAQNYMTKKCGMQNGEKYIGMTGWTFEDIGYVNSIKVTEVDWA